MDKKGEGSSSGGYSSFGTFSRSNSPERVQDWLKENFFDDAVCETLNGYTGQDLMALTRQDVIDLIGHREGIRLFNRIIYQGQAAKPKDEQFLQSTPSWKRKKGSCSALHCSLPVVTDCSLQSCGKRLCAKHTFKNLLTSAVYCESCAEQFSLFNLGLETSTKLGEYCVIS